MMATASHPRRSDPPFRTWFGSWIGSLLALALVLAGLTGCDRKGYSQATPEDVIKSARAMVEKGEARKLEQLIYADSPEMRQLIKRVGKLCGSLGQLALQINTSFPKEVEEIKKNANSGGVAQLMGEFSNQRNRRMNPIDEPPANDPFADALKTILADPYGWLRDNSGRLTTIAVDDNTAALMWDGKPMLAPIGMIMKRDQGKWYLVLPTNLPMVSQFMPRTPDEYRVMEMLVASLDNALKDVTKDIQTGKLADLTETARATGEKAFPPVAMVMISYSKVLEARKNAASGGSGNNQAAPKASPKGPGEGR